MCMYYLRRKRFPGSSSTRISPKGTSYVSIHDVTITFSNAKRHVNNIKKKDINSKTFHSSQQKNKYIERYNRKIHFIVMKIQTTNVMFSNKSQQCVDAKQILSLLEKIYLKYSFFFQSSDAGMSCHNLVLCCNYVIPLNYC
jgi:hypothetical protein